MERYLGVVAGVERARVVAGRGAEVVPGVRGAVSEGLFTVTIRAKAVPETPLRFYNYSRPNGLLDVRPHPYGALTILGVRAGPTATATAGIKLRGWPFYRVI